MERFDFTFRKGRKPAFADVPENRKRTLFGVDYIQLKGRQLGDFFVTRDGWAVMESLVPENWFTGHRFSKVGRALAGATGAVYRVPVPHRSRRDFALVVKFSRFGQSVGVTMVDPKLNFSEAHINRIKNARFLCPFEEFGNLAKLRRSTGLTIPTQAPLAIYSPPTRYLEWQLGREPYLRSIHNRNLRLDQQAVPEDQRFEYDRERQYVLLYRWIDGVDAEQAVDQGLLTEPEMVDLGQRARQTLAERGWEVMDHKPRHVIIRVGRNGRLLQRDDFPRWCLVDYELLYPLSNGL